MPASDIAAGGQAVTRTFGGLYSQHNRLNEVPPGAAVVADNVVGDREGILGKRRGFNLYGQALSLPAGGLFRYRERIIALDGTTMKYDSDGLGTWASWAGTFAAPDAAYGMRSLEELESFYFTTSAGPYVVDSLTGTPRRSGIPQGLDIATAPLGTGASWFLGNTQVAYRVIWMRRDANKTEKRGDASRREVAVNAGATVTWARAATTATITHAAHGYSTGDIIRVVTSSDTTAIPLGNYTITVTGAGAYTITVPNAGGVGGTAADTLTVAKEYALTVSFTVPPDIIAGDFWELYRTTLSAGINASPRDDYFLVQRMEVSAADITAGFISFADTRAEDLLGEPAYINASDETVTLGNARPPLARFMAQWKGHVWYGNTEQPHILQLALLEVSGLVDGTSSITITSEIARTYTFSAAENIAANQFQRVTTFPTLAQNLEATMKSLERVINRETGNTIITARYADGEEDAPGTLILEKRTLGSLAFSVTANNSTTGSKFSPTLPTAGATVISDNARKENGLYRAKLGKPDAVPRLKFRLMGSANKDLLGLQALPDALLVYTKSGLFKVTGDTDGLAGDLFVYDEVDPTLELTAPETLCALDNTACGFTTQGCTRSSPNGTQIFSRQLEPDFRALSRFQNFATLTRAWGYESERKFFLAAKRVASDTSPKVVWTWNYLTNKWTRWRKALSYGVIIGDLLYVAHASEPRILRERKTFAGTGEDFMDETVDATITASSTMVNAEGDTVSLLTVTYAYGGEPLQEGALVEQGFFEDRIAAVTSLGGSSYSLEMTRDLSTRWTVAAATVSLPIDSEVQWAPETAGNATTMKQFPEAHIYLERNSRLRFRVGFFSDAMTRRELSDLIRLTPNRGWGSSPWGSSPWGDAQEGTVNPIRLFVPTDHQRSRALQLSFLHATAKESFDILQYSLNARIYSTRTTMDPR